MYKIEVQITGEPGWHSNELTFAKRAEAEAYARDLQDRWTRVTAWRVTPSEVGVLATFQNKILTVQMDTSSEH